MDIMRVRIGCVYGLGLGEYGLGSDVYGLGTWGSVKDRGSVSNKPKEQFAKVVSLIIVEPGKGGRPWV